MGSCGDTAGSVSLGPGACEMLYVPFKSGVYFLWPSGPPKSKSC